MGRRLRIELDLDTSCPYSPERATAMYYAYELEGRITSAEWLDDQFGRPKPGRGLTRYFRSRRD